MSHPRPPGAAANGRDAGPLQDMSTLSLMETCCKWARKITNIARIPEYVTLAFRQAYDAAPGPVYLEVPSDFAWEVVDDAGIKWPVKARTNAIPFGDPSLVDQAAELLVNAKHPAILMGDGARFNMGDHAKDVVALSDYLKMPLGVGIGGLASNSLRGMFDDESKNPAASHR